MDISKSAFSVMIIALLPPNSNIDLPKRPATLEATSLPTAVEPVNDISWTSLLSPSSVLLHDPDYQIGNSFRKLIFFQNFGIIF
jgi:hypothetical protein